MEGVTLGLAAIVGVGDIEGMGVLDGVIDIDTLGVAEGVTEALGVRLGVTDALGVVVGVTLRVIETDGVMLIVGVTVGVTEGVGEGDAGINDFITEKDPQLSSFCNFMLVAEYGISTVTPNTRSCTSTLDRTKLVLS